MKYLMRISVFCFSNLIVFGLMSAFASATEISGRLTVYVVNYPLKYFAERIAGDHARVVFPAPAEGDPAYWMPDAKTIGAYQQADLVLLNGANYAKWVKKVSLPRSRMVTPLSVSKTNILSPKRSSRTAMALKGRMPMNRLSLPHGLISTLQASRQKP